jgi:FAD/FMN-containing dehydrogenase
MTDVQAEAMDALRTAIAGTVILPGEAGYDEARAIWNGAIDTKPAVFVKARTSNDVVAALGFARARGLEVSVRGGGHSYSGSALVDGGMTIDLSEMRSVTVDPVRKTAAVGGGATWLDLDAAAQAHALAVPGGFVSHTGVGGLTLGGGLGWLSRQHGLTCDNLLAAEVVTADGTVVRASSDEHSDLLWALKGGGGNFGVVTSFEYQLHDVGPLVHLALFFFGLDQGGQALRVVREFLHDLPDGYGAFLAGLNAPPEPFVPEQYQLAPGYAVAIVGFGDAEEHARMVAPIPAAVLPLWQLVTPIPYVNLQQMFDPAAPWGILGYEKAIYLEELTDEAIDVIVHHMPQKASPLTIVPIFAMGGAFGRGAEDATAFGGSRSTRYVVSISALAPSAELLEADTAWVRRFWTDLVPYASNTGGYINFMTEYDDDRVRTTFGPEKYARLAAVKAAYDPDNVFHINANIKPAG